MIPSEFRLKKRKDFNQVFQKGETLSENILTIKYLRTNKKDLKLGFSVGLKFSKKSSKRNKAKRWMRESVRPMLGKMKRGYEIVFLINSSFPIGEINYSLVSKELRFLIKKAGLFR